MPRARRSGGYMSPAAVRARFTVPAEAPMRANPDDGEHRLEKVERQGGGGGSGRPEDESDGEHRHPAATIHHPPGHSRGERPRDEEDGRAEPEQAGDAGDEGERDRRHAGDELERRRVDRHRRGQEHGVAPDRELVHQRDSSTMGRRRPTARPEMPLSRSAHSLLRATSTPWRSGTITDSNSSNPATRRFISSTATMPGWDVSSIQVPPVPSTLSARNRPRGDEGAETPCVVGVFRLRGVDEGDVDGARAELRR
jgi:hypothetical protein